MAHPAVEQALTRRGAGLWRIMLVVLGGTIVIGSMTLFRLAGQSRDDRLPAASQSRVLRREQWWMLCGLTGLALVVRAMRIHESLWYDEIASWMMYNAGVNSWGAVVGSFLDPINHVLHTLLNRWSSGESLVGLLGVEVAFRLPTLLFSVMTMPIMFGLGRATQSDRAGMIATTLAAIAPVCVLEGVEARGYAQMIFFSAAATWLFVIAWRETCRPGLWLLYAVICALGVWSQFVTAWIAIGHGAWLVWRLARRREDRRSCASGFVALALAGLISITLYSPMIPGVLEWKNNFFSDRGDEPRIFGPEGWHALLQLGGAWCWWTALPGLGMFGAGIVVVLSRMRLPPRRDCSEADVLALALLGLPLMVLTVAVSGSWLYARFMLFAVPGALLALAAGIDAIWQWRRDAGIAALALMVIAWVADLAVRPPKQPLREAMAFVSSHANVGDGVLEIGVAHQVLLIYTDPDKSLRFGISLFHGRRDLPVKLDAMRPRWVIVEYPLKVEDDRYVALRDRGYVHSATFKGWADWIHGDIVVYERGGAKPQAAER